MREAARISTEHAQVLAAIARLDLSPDRPAGLLASRTTDLAMADQLRVIYPNDHEPPPNEDAAEVRA